ncbi:SRPBCC family protein [Pollutibacter soli]|uniref:SRPBCC family protein n=1 Tax=Pollutibacter soli TaxID=3034157 RepID=UPI003013A58D
MSVHSFQRVQNFTAPLEEVWNFFASPSNLAVLTPEYLNLNFTNKIYGSAMYPGQIITYNVRPLFGIPFFWMTEITQVRPMEYFIDQQVRGPFSLWHHQHHFRETDSGVEMTDLIHYKIPLGMLGSIAAPIVQKKLREIFGYRFRKGEELFNVKRSTLNLP